MISKIDLGNPTWEELLKMEIGTIIKYDKWENKSNIYYLIIRSTTSLCAYIGIPLDHPLARKSYNDLDIKCHYGLTYSSGDSDFHPKNLWWYGWDYSHFGDYCFFYDEMNICSFLGEKKWLVEDIMPEIAEAIESFKQIYKTLNQ